MMLPDDVRMTPMLKQYTHWKRRYPDCLLFFRMGDFYEMFFEDAKEASAILDIALTARDQDRKIPMAGVPYHSVDGYLERLVASGKKVAICEQVSEPDGRSLVDRQVVRVVTPGTFLPAESSSEGRLACINVLKDEVSVALLNFASGILFAGTVMQAAARSEIAGFSPTEMIFPAGQEREARSMLAPGGKCVLSPGDRDDFRVPEASRRICRDWGVSSLEGYGLSDLDPACGCAAVILSFIEKTQFRSPRGYVELRPLLEKGSMHIDPPAIGNLEIAGGNGGSLYETLNRCRTPMGKRKLGDWLLHPLLDAEAISARQDAVSTLLEDPAERGKLQSSLSGCGDLDRSVSRLAFGNAGPRDLGVVRDTLSAVPGIRKHLGALGLDDLLNVDDNVSTLGETLASALEDDLPRVLQGGDIIRRGFDPGIDALRDIKNNEQGWLENFLLEKKKETGIRNMKIGFNKVFGYYLEVSKSSIKDVPDFFVRKQTLVSGERYITEELKDFEERMLAAAGQVKAREEELYRGLCLRVNECSSFLRSLSEDIAVTDVLASFAQVAALNRYSRPEVNYGDSIDIRGGRHPIVENSLNDGAFTPNDLILDGGDNRIAIVTGPNMAGKSTYLRMAALLAIMAQAGSFIPAESATLGIVEKVFSRIGARDEISRGRSTFMMEMIETANILNNVTSRSLVILDEVGRGTSTYDGMSIAWAVLENLHGSSGKRPKVLFATHFHELTALSSKLPGVKNLSMAVEEKGSDIVFLYKVVPCPADRSYGIEVARLAGIPGDVVERSRSILQQFEKGKRSLSSDIPSSASRRKQLPLFDEGAGEIVDELADLNPDLLSPMQALEMLYSLREKAREAKGSS